MNTCRYLLLSLLLAAAASVYAAGVPTMDVTVATADGRLAYKGKTAPNGTFATGKLEPGQYTIQLTSKNSALKGNTFALVASAGKKKTVADAVAGDKFAAGVAMRIEVGKGLNITGQVSSGGAAGNNPNTKVVNGKTYYWVKGGTGSNIGGRWMTKEEAKAAGLNVGTYSSQAIERMQEHSYNPQGD